MMVVVEEGIIYFLWYHYGLSDFIKCVVFFCWSIFLCNNVSQAIISCSQGTKGILEKDKDAILWSNKDFIVQS